MIPQMDEELNLSLAQVGTVLRNVFNQLSAEAIYYAYLSKQTNENQVSADVQCDTTTQSGHHRKWASNKGEELHNSKKNKDIQNKNKLFYYLVCEDYALLKAKYTCEVKEGLYQAIITGCGPKATHNDKNHNSHKKFVHKSRDNNLSNQNPNEGYSANKNAKMRFRSNNKSTNFDNEDSNVRLTRRNEMYLFWGLAGDYRLMKWKKKREKAEGRYQKYLANRRKRELKKEMTAQNMLKQSHATSSKSASGFGVAMKPVKKFLKKKPFVIQKSLAYDYRHCLKKKKNREDDESFYQLYLANITPPLPHSISGASYVVSSAPKVTAPKVLCTGRMRGKKLNVSFDLPDEDELLSETVEATDLFLFQCLALDSARMSWKQRCESNEAYYQTTIGMKENNMTL